MSTGNLGHCAEDEAAGHNCKRQHLVCVCVCVCVCVGDRMNLQRQLENFRQKTIKSTLKLCWVGLLELSSVSCPLLAPLLNVKTKLNENHPLLRTLPVDFTTAFPHGSTPLRKLYFLSPLILVP